jgi:hypothetical protein
MLKAGEKVARSGTGEVVDDSFPMFLNSALAW